MSSRTAPLASHSTFCPSLLEMQTTGLNGHPPRIVLDTSVVVSALVFGGPMATRLRRAWRKGFCRPMVCSSTLQDLIHQLGHDRLGFSVSEQQQMLGEYLPYVLKVRPQVAAPALADTAEPAGLLFVQLALAGRAHLLVSSDPALLTMGDRLPFPVLALEPFLHWLRETPITPSPLHAAAPRPVVTRLR
jgi:predicted nucleic acid-binding protein